nr:fibrohexamerin-like protein 1 [Pseudoips prasinana]
MKALGCAVFVAIFYFCLGRPDDSDDCVRPCPNYDKGCVGRVFADELQCTLVRGKIPNTRTIQYLPVNYPSGNISGIYTNAVAKGFRDFKINEFYINRRTKTLVLEIILKSIFLSAPGTRAFFHRRGEEPIITSGYAFAIYKDYSLTLTVYNVDGRSNHDMSDFHVYAYFTDVDLTSGYGRSCLPKEPGALTQLQQVLDTVGVSIQEDGLSIGPLFMSYVLPCKLPVSMWS